MGIEKDSAQNYKGFAYVKGSDKPYILYGTSEEYIISRLQNYNRARSSELKYSTVNIGSLVEQIDDVQVRYENYKRYEVATGRNITPLYLTLPPLSNDEFKQLTNKLKEEGAKYNPHKKRWYAYADEIERFSDYVPQEKQDAIKVIDIKQELQEAMQEVDKTIVSPIKKEKYSISSIDVQYVVTLENKRQIALSAGDVSTEYKDKTFQEFLQGLDMTLDNVLAREQAEVFESEYILDVSKDIDINECTIYFSDGRDPMTLYGDQFGINFSSLDKDAAQELVENYLLNQADPYKIEDQLEFIINRPITAFAIHPVNHEFYKIEGTVFEQSEKDVTLRFTGDKISVNIPQEYMQYEKETLYSSAQKKWIEDVMRLDISPIEYKFMCNSSYTSAQLETIAESFKDGLRVEDIKLYADPQIPSWQMDLYRFGMQHGISYSEIQTINNLSQDWITGRDKLTATIKEHRKGLAANIAATGFKPTPEIVKKLEYLNHLTGKENSVKDVCQAFKQDIYKDNPKVDHLVKELGRTFQMQEMAKIPIQ